MADGAKISQLSKDVAGGKDGKNCPFCERTGLPLLPVRYAYVPDEQSAGLPQVGFKGSGADKAPASGKFVLRVLNSGFVYLYDERGSGSWRVFAATSAGHLREFPATRKNPPGAVQMTCSRNDKTVSASMITIESTSANKPKRIWLAYSRTWWSKDVLAFYTSESNRKQRMTTVNMGAVPQNLPLDSHAVDKAGESLRSHLAEYQGKASAFKESPWEGVDRANAAVDTAKKMDALASGKGAFIALADPVGNAMEIAHWARAAKGVLSAVDIGFTREHFVEHGIEQLKKGFEKAGKKAEWDKDYQTHIDLAKITHYQSDYKNAVGNKKEINEGRSADFVYWTQNCALFKLARDHDYSQDPKYTFSGLAFTAHMADINFGIGRTEEENKLAESWAKGTAAEQDNMLHRVLGANQKGLIEFFKTTDNQAGLSDVVKNARSSILGWKERYKEAAEQIEHAGGEKVTSAAAAVAEATAEDRAFVATLKVQESLNKFLHSMAGPLTAVSEKSPGGLRVLVLTGVIWCNAEFEFRAQALTPGEFVRKMHETVWNRSLEAQVTRIAHDLGDVEMRLNLAAVADEFGIRFAGRVEVAVLVIDSSGTDAGVTHAATKRATANALTEGLPLASSETNLFKATKAALKASAGNAIFATVGLLLQNQLYDEAFKEYASKLGNDEEAKTAKMKIFAAMTGVIGLQMELIGAGLKISSEITAAVGKVALKQLASHLAFASKVAAGVGGIVGGVGGFYAAYATWREAVGLREEGDGKSASWRYFSAAAFGFFGGFSIASGVAEIFSTFVFLGPWAWAALAFAALVVAMVLLFKSEESKLNPVQHWLAMSLFGSAKKTFEVKEEAEQFDKLFDMPFNVKLSWPGQGPIYAVESSMTFPAIGSETVLEYEFTFERPAETPASLGGSGIQKFGESWKLDGSAPVLNDPHQIAGAHGVGGSLRANRSSPVKRNEVSWGLTFGRIPVGTNFGDYVPMFLTISLNAKLYPDKKNQPELVLPSSQGMQLKVQAPKARGGVRAP